MSYLTNVFPCYSDILNIFLPFILSIKIRFSHFNFNETNFKTMRYLLEKKKKKILHWRDDKILLIHVPYFFKLLSPLILLFIFLSLFLNFNFYYSLVKRNLLPVSKCTKLRIIYFIHLLVIRFFNTLNYLYNFQNFISKSKSNSSLNFHELHPLF